MLCQNDRNCQTRRTSSDHSDWFFLFLRYLNLHAIQIGIGDISFNAGKMNRISFFTKYTVACTLLLMVTDNGTDHRHWIILEQFFSCLHHLMFLEHLYDMRNRCMHRTAFHTSWFLAVQAAICLFYNMNSHSLFSLC